MITPIRSYTYSPAFMNKNSKAETPKTTDIKPEELNKNKPKFKLRKFEEMPDKDKKVFLYSTVALAGLTGLLIGRGRKSYMERFARAELAAATARCSDAVDELTRVRAELDDLRGVYEGSAGSEKALRKTTAELRELFEDLVNGDLSPKEIREQLFNRVRARVFDGELGYDVMSPPITGRGITTYADAVDLPAAGTANRAGMQSLTIPRLSDSGEFRFELPSGEKRISHMPSRPFRAVQDQPTTISISYADSVNWNNDKVARDILQNFYDGHGQTLDGVRFEFGPARNGKYRVKISGDSTYTVDKALFIGESSKRDDARSAGNYGEGLKMAVLKLLKSGGADNVRVGSDNWELTYKLSNSDLTEKQILSYSIDKVEKLDGNFLEFETTDRDLLEKLRLSINRFYHSGNEHFKRPDFENDMFGVKVDLSPNDKGGLYIAGQRFEYENGYSNFDNASLFIKEKPEEYILDVSRDRISLSSYDLGRLGSWLASSSQTSPEEGLKLISALKKYWGKTYGNDQVKGLDKFLEYFLSSFHKMNDTLHIKFPENCVAYSLATPEIILDLESKGYKICKEEFAKFGMPTIRELLGDARAHEVLQPNEVQEQKIRILKDAIKILGKNLEGKHFTAEELDTKIFLFSAKGAKDAKLYSDTRAEAIIDRGTTLGFWLDRDYLDSASFSKILETCLHELSHKAGGDESMAFSYKLTDVNADAIDSLLNNVPALHDLQALNKLWESLIV